MRIMKGRHGSQGSAGSTGKFEISGLIRVSERTQMFREREREKQGDGVGGRGQSPAVLALKACPHSFHRLGREGKWKERREIKGRGKENEGAHFSIVFFFFGFFG